MLLPIVRDALLQQRLLTYESAAIELGRGKDHARAVAQMCDLLDAAAAYARVPLLALVVVREKSGHINRKAWAGDDVPRGMREQVISKSMSHHFTEENFAAIGASLDTLKDCGNRAAWKKVRRELTTEGLYAAIGGVSEPIFEDAIEDLGSDLVKRKSVFVTRYARDSRIRRQVEIRSGGNCELCRKPGFERPDGSRYIETHHIIALADDGADRLSNVIALCPDHHREAHYGSRADELERRMIEVVSALTTRFK